MPERSRSSCENWLAASIPSAFSLFLGHSALAETTATFERLTTSGGRTTLGRQSTPLDAGTSISVENGVQVLLEGSVEYNTSNGTCTFTSSGSYSAANSPTHGMLSYGILDHTVQSSDVCNGHTFPYAVVYYTWTDNQSGATQDSFAVQWQTPDGRMGGPYAYIAELQASPSFTLSVLSPFLLGSPSLSDIELQNLLPNISNLSTVAAKGLSADGTSAAIVLVSTNTQSDVTLSADNGTTLLPYDPQYLTYAPNMGGNTTLTISAANLFAIGSLYYAAALVQAPPLGVTPAYSSPINLTAQQQGGALQQLSINLAPPPVLLVHGLWGNNTSLDLYNSTLIGESPWSAYPNLVYPMTYPGTASFTSAQSIGAMKTAVASLQNTEQSEGIVGARVDVIAHSMGGLLVRSYSGSPNYQQIFDRGLGNFNTIVSLDTPEAGSAIAAYLFDHQKDTRQATGTSDGKAYAFWNTACGTTSNTTVAQCLAANGDAVTGGAVDSLIPMSRALQSSPSPNIPGASWRAITATNTAGLARAAVSLLLRAVSPKLKSAATINGILGTPNDDVVSLVSQLTGSPPAYVTDPGLAHTGFLGRGVDEGVNNSSLAVTQAACWLSDPTSPDCSKISNAVNTTNKPQSDYSFRPSHFFLPFPLVATVGKPISLDIQAPSVRSIEVRQLGEEGLDVSNTIAVEASGRFLVTPLVPGRVRFQTTVEFMDGTFEITNNVINVSITSSEVASLRGDSKLRRIVLPDAESVYYFSPEITLRNLPYVIKIGRLAKYRVLSLTSDPAVVVDQAGMVSAVHSGSAKIQLEFDGHTDTIDFVVE